LKALKKLAQGRRVVSSKIYISSPEQSLFGTAASKTGDYGCLFWCLDSAAATGGFAVTVGWSVGEHEGAWWLSDYKNGMDAVRRLNIPEYSKLVLLQGVADQLPHRSHSSQEHVEKLAARNRASLSVETLIRKARGELRTRFGSDAVPNET
jgi:hypothetical protein